MSLDCGFPVVIIVQKMMSGRPVFIAYKKKEERDDTASVSGYRGRHLVKFSVDSTNVSGMLKAIAEILAKHHVNHLRDIIVYLVLV